MEVRSFLLLAGGNFRDELLRHRKTLHGLLSRADERLDDEPEDPSYAGR